MFGWRAEREDLGATAACWFSPLLIDPLLRQLGLRMQLRMQNRLGNSDRSVLNYALHRLQLLPLLQLLLLLLLRRLLRWLMLLPD